MRISQDSLDDILQDVFTQILRKNQKYQGTHGGPYREVLGAHLTLKQPLARASRTETRERIASCLSESLWYLSGTYSLAMIEYWIPGYKKHLDRPEAETTPGAYGPRLFGPMRDKSNVFRVIDQLAKNPASRTAVIQIFDNDDLSQRDEPCTCVLQFFVRSRRLHMVVYMRSNDAYKGLPHDAFAFTWLQEMIARSLGIALGTYQHMVGSLHIYDDDEVGAKEYLNEGWQEVHEASMPTMPLGDPWKSIDWLLQIESSLRTADDQNIDNANVDDPNIDDYWRDLAKILRIQRLLKIQPRTTTVRRQLVLTGQSITSNYYAAFIRRKSGAVTKTPGPLFEQKPSKKNNDQTKTDD